jgi:hypothetical protein
MASATQDRTKFFPVTKLSFISSVDCRQITTTQGFQSIGNRVPNSWIPALGCCIF